QSRLYANCLRRVGNTSGLLRLRVSGHTDRIPARSSAGLSKPIIAFCPGTTEQPGPSRQCNTTPSEPKKEICTLCGPAPLDAPTPLFQSLGPPDRGFRVPLGELATRASIFVHNPDRLLALVARDDGQPFAIRRPRCLAARVALDPHQLVWMLAVGV